MSACWFPTADLPSYASYRNRVGYQKCSHGRHLCAPYCPGYYNDDETDDSAKNSVIQEYAGGFDYRGTNAGRLQVDVLYNDTNQAKARGGPPRLVRINNPVNMATQAFLETRCGSSTECSAKLVSLRMMPQPARSLNLDFSSLLGPLFYVWLLQLLFPIGLAAIVYEKEMRLRMMVKMMGMEDGAYWLVTYLWNLLLFMLFAIVLYGGGNLIGLAFFTLNSGSLQFLFYFLYGNLQIAFTILVSVIFVRSKTATVASYLWVGVIAHQLNASFYFLFTGGGQREPCMLSLSHC